MIAILCLLQCSRAHAAEGVQGGKPQGTALQGHETQGTAVQGHETQGHALQGHETQGTAVQGHETQGRTIQGRGTQGVRVQGRETQGRTLRAGVSEPRPWLQGVRFVGLISRPDSEGNHKPGALEITGFRGDKVLALSWDGLARWEPVELSPRELVGMTWLEHRCESGLDCERIAYRITSATQDDSRNTMPLYPNNNDLWLYQIEYTSSASANPDTWHNVCAKHGQNGGQTGRKKTGQHSGLGMFVDGRWNNDGSWQPGGYTFACTSGVITKCARSWGYKPWKRLVAPGGYLVDMRPLHQACTRAARADYCGDGIPHTRDGTMIDMFDIHGFNVREPDSDFVEESGFTPRGARWVARERWPRTPASNTPWHSPWIDLSTCRRPRHAPAAADDEVLIQVWSRLRAAMP